MFTTRLRRHAALGRTLPLLALVCAMLARMPVEAVAAAAPAAPRTLLWHDEFDQPAGTGPEAGHWMYDLGDSGWGNEELQCYTDSRANSFVAADPEATDGKVLVIRARRDAAGRTTSARLTTHGKFATKFGRIEARLKLPRGQGIWPAFWMLGENRATVAWPHCGEIDIMELLGHEPGRVYGSLHGPGYSGTAALTGSATHAEIGTDRRCEGSRTGGEGRKNEEDNAAVSPCEAADARRESAVGGSVAAGSTEVLGDSALAARATSGGDSAEPVAVDFSHAYHIFAVEWQPGRIEWFCDGVRYHTVSAADLPEGAHWVFDDSPHFLLLNLAVGGRWPGYPDASTHFPQEYRIDYIRVYAPLPDQEP